MLALALSTLIAVTTVSIGIARAAGLIERTGSEGAPFIMALDRDR